MLVKSPEAVHADASSVEAILAQSSRGGRGDWTRVGPDCKAVAIWGGRIWTGAVMSAQLQHDAGGGGGLPAADKSQFWPGCRASVGWLMRGETRGSRSKGGPIDCSYPKADWGDPGAGRASGSAGRTRRSVRKKQEVIVQH